MQQIPGPASMRSSTSVSVPLLAGMGMQHSDHVLGWCGLPVSVPLLAGMGMQPHTIRRDQPRCSCFSPLISGDGDATPISLKMFLSQSKVSVPLLAGMGMQLSIQEMLLLHPVCFSPLISGDGDATIDSSTTVAIFLACFSPLISGDGDATISTPLCAAPALKFQSPY